MLQDVLPDLGQHRELVGSISRKVELRFYEVVSEQQ